MFERLLFLVLLSLTFQMSAQSKFPPLSARASVYQVVGFTEVKIEYERPSVRGREVFGALVPWNKLWRTGAGYCTKISFSRNVRVGGQKVRAGTYSIYTIPNPKEWVVILNRDTTLYGTYGYSQELDEVRFKVVSTPAGRFYETLSLEIDLVPNDARIYLSWADTQISFDLETFTDEEMDQYIQKELLTKEENESDSYAAAAEYLLYQDGSSQLALKLTQFAIDIDKGNQWARSLRIKFFEKEKRYLDALEEVGRYRQYIEQSNVEDKERTLQELEAEKKRLSLLSEINRP